MPSVTIDGSSYEAEAGDRLIDVINRSGKEIPQVCYHPQLGPVQTCDTCIVEVDGKLTRACGTTISSALTVLTKVVAADRAQREAFDRILGNHLLYCTVWKEPRTATKRRPLNTSKIDYAGRYTSETSPQTSEM